MPSLPDDPSPDAQQAVDVVGTVHPEFAAWRAAHPQATFAEIEAAVEAALSRLRAQLITDTLPAPADATAAAAPPVPPRCATCAVPRDADGTPHPHTTALSYFARMADAATFSQLATWETHHRGTTTAGGVAAVLDGAVWHQGVVDLHRPDAVRILDFPHAAQHLSAAAHAVWGEGNPAAAGRLGGWLGELKRGNPADVLAAVATLPTTAARDPAMAAAVVQQTVEYLPVAGGSGRTRRSARRDCRLAAGAWRAGTRW